MNKPDDGGMEALAHKIATALCTNYDGEVATRLKLCQKQSHALPERDLGGRCFRVVCLTIEEVLVAERKEDSDEQD